MVGTRNLLPYFNFQLLRLTHIDTRWLYLLTPSRERGEGGGVPLTDVQKIQLYLSACNSVAAALLWCSLRLRSSADRCAISGALSATATRDQGPGPRHADPDPGPSPDPLPVQKLFHFYAAARNDGTRYMYVYICVYIYIVYIALYTHTQLHVESATWRCSRH